jgi:hypothetical protein
MSTRYIKKDNKIIIGLAKNASQSIKQISLIHDWMIREEDHHIEDNLNFLEIHNPNVTIYFPLRNIFERARSEFFQFCYDEFSVQNEYTTIEEFLENTIKPNEFVPEWNYFFNTPMVYFITNIFCNASWNGCKFLFFDLKHFNKTFTEYLGIDIEIPKVNDVSSREEKMILNELISHDNFLKDYINKNFLRHLSSVDNLILDKIKKSKHWIDLDG